MSASLSDMTPAWPGLLDARTRKSILCPRVSGDPQEKHGSSLEMQEQELRKLADHYGLEVVHVMRWTGTATLSRQAFWDEVIAGIKSGRWHQVLFYELARMTRKGAFDAFSRLNEIKTAGGDWYIQILGQEYKHPIAGPILLASLASMHQQYIVNLKAAVSNGIRGRVTGAKNGVGARPLGNGRAPIGLAWNEGRDAYTVVEGRAEWATVEAAFAAVVEAGGLRGGARLLNERGYRTRGDATRPPMPWSATTLGYLIRNPTYKGEVHCCRFDLSYTATETKGRRERPVEERAVFHGRVTRDPACGGLISDETWAAANGAVRPRVKAPRPVIVDDALLRGGHVLCGECGWTAAVNRSTSHRGEKTYRHVGYRCNRRRPEYEQGGRKCPGCGIMTAEILDREVWAVVEQWLGDETRVDAAIDRALAGERPRADQLAAHDTLVATKQAEFKASARALGELKLEGASDRTLEVLKTDLAALEKTLVEAEAEGERLRGQAEGYRRAEAWRDAVKKALRERTGMPTETLAEKRDLLKWLGCRVAVYRPGRAPEGSEGARWRFITLEVLPEDVPVTVSSSVNSSSHNHSYSPRLSLLPADRG